MARQKNIPNLRFPEFEGKWERNQLSEIASKQNNKNSHGLIKDVFTNSATYGVINQRDYFDRDIANRQNLDGYYIIEYDEFVYNPRISVSAPVGPISRNLIGTGVMSPLYTVFRFKSGNLDFFEQYFNSTKWYNYLKSAANYGARFDRMNLTNSDFFSLPIFLPSNQEQQKIASFFTAIDQKISQLKRKLTLLEQYKKGVMQLIFSQTIRFKDDNGQEFPKWEKMTGDALFETVSNKNHNSDLPILAITQEHGAIPRDMIDYYITVTEQSIESYKVVEKGDFIISLRSFQGGIEYSEYKGICSPAYIILKATQRIDHRYFKYYFKTDKYITDLNRKLEGIRDGKMISYKYFSEIKIDVPILQEQTKIANFLSTIDDKISHTRKQIEKAEVWKKGLMQQMFC